MRVAILGCGPAGMFAAHAAIRAGHEVVIFSKNRKSFMRGAQYLHEPIPGLSRNPFTIHYKLEGEVEGYRDKVYGDMSDVQVSPETLVGSAAAWDIREAYDDAWELYKGLVYDIDLTTASKHWWLHIMTHFDLVISSVPAKLLCSNPEHEFRSQLIWATDYLKPMGAFEGDPMPDNIVVCSGFEDDWWYRMSRIQGWENTEYPHDKKPRKSGSVWEVEKPIDTNCTCHPQIARVGRYGQWKKGVLTHHAFTEASALVNLIGARA